MAALPAVGNLWAGQEEYATAVLCLQEKFRDDPLVRVRFWTALLYFFVAF
jgi:hypothetical protein